MGLDISAFRQVKRMPDLSDIDLKYYGKEDNLSIRELEVK